MKRGKFILPKNHKPFMKVAKGGSSCANCKFLTSDKKHCGNTLFVKWYGTDKLPEPVDRYCSDWYEPSPEYMASGGKITKNRTGRAVDPLNAERFRKKREHIEQISNSIRGLRGTVTKDLKSDDEKTRLTALVVAIIDKTFERVGNEDSADAGHLGVTGLRKKNIHIIGNKVHLDYIGKSGVRHEKSFSDALVAKTLKKAIKDSPDKNIFVTSDGFKIKSDKVNRFLSEYNVTAKDLRGFHANKLIIDKLSKQEIPDEVNARKKAFRKALKYSADKVGHKPTTLHKHYLMPELQTEYVSNSRILDLSKFHSGGNINDGTKGGLLIGETDKNGGSGIVAATPTRDVILGGGEIIINENSAKKYCEELSEINQDGGGVAIPCDIEGNTTNTNDDSHELGGNIKHTVDQNNLILQEEKKIQNMEKEKLGQHYIGPGTIITDNLSTMKYEVIERTPGGLNTKQIVSIGIPTELFIPYDQIEALFNIGGLGISGYETTDNKMVALAIDNIKKSYQLIDISSQSELLKSTSHIEPKYSKDAFMRSGGKVTEGKVRMKEIKIHWAEGDNSKYDKFPKVYKSWSQVNSAIVPIYHDNVEGGGGGYNKVKFDVLFEDGEVYGGRLDVSEREDNPTITTNVIGQHIKEYLTYLLSDRSGTSEKSKQEVRDWLDKYDLDSNPTEKVITSNDINDAIAGFRTMLQYATGKEKQDIQDAIDGMKAMIELMPDNMEKGGNMRAQSTMGYRIIKSDGTIKFAGTDDPSWFKNIEEARETVDYSKGEKIYEYNHSGDKLWEAFDKGGKIEALKPGDRFKNPDGVIFIVDEVGHDDIFGRFVRTSIEGGEKGNYKDSEDEFIEFMKEEGAVKLAEGQYDKGGKLGFKKLSDKVAREYVGKEVPKKYQAKYGKRYSREEAQEVGNATAAKIERQKGQLT